MAIVIFQLYCNVINELTLPSLLFSNDYGSDYPTIQLVLMILFTGLINFEYCLMVRASMAMLTTMFRFTLNPLTPVQ